METALAICDLHGRMDLLAAILHRHPEVSCALLAGDITQFGGTEDVAAALAILRDAGILPGMIAAVGGNCDPAAARTALESGGCSAEGKALELGFARVVGAGGGLRLQGHTSFERRDEELADALIGAFSHRGLQPQKNSSRSLVVLTHTPPHGTAADLRGGMHSGSRRFGELLREREPDLWVCGHIHESRCAGMEGRTLLLNPGPAQSGRYAIVKFRTDPSDILEGTGNVKVRASLMELS